MECRTINHNIAKVKQKRPFTLFKASHKIHKWLMLFIGTQFVIWSVTGAYMVFFDINYIHGNSLVKTHQTKINPANLTYPTTELFQQFPTAKNLSVGVLIDQEVYRFNVARQQVLVDASSGEVLSPLDKSLAIAVAKHNYTSDEDITKIELITSKSSFGLNARHLPVWLVQFDHFSSPTLYISANNGRVVSKRHQFWYVFDWMFRFHIMDYGQDQDASNWLLFFVASFGFLATLSGLILTYFKVLKPILIARKKTRGQQNEQPHAGGKS